MAMCWLCAVVVITVMAHPIYFIMSHVSVCQLHVTRSSITNWKFALRTRSESNWRNCFKLPPDVIFLGLSQGHGQSVPSPLTRLPMSGCKTAWILSVQNNLHLISASNLGRICIAASTLASKTARRHPHSYSWRGLNLWPVPNNVVSELTRDSVVNPAPSDHHLYKG